MTLDALLLFSEKYPNHASQRSLSASVNLIYASHNAATQTIMKCLKLCGIDVKYDFYNTRNDPWSGPLMIDLDVFSNNYEIHEKSLHFYNSFEM